MRSSSVKQRQHSTSGMTLADVLACIFVICLMALLVTAWVRRQYAQSSRLNCVNNLKNIGLGFRTFAVDYNGLYPWQITPREGGIEIPKPGQQAGVSNHVFTAFACISNELSTPRFIRCTEERRRMPATNTWAYVLSMGTEAAKFPSYFIGTDATESQPNSILSGDENLLIPAAGLDYQTSSHYNRITRVTGADLHGKAGQGVGWTSDLHRGKGNLLLGDGSVTQTTSPAELTSYLIRASTNGPGRFHLFLPALDN